MDWFWNWKWGWEGSEKGKSRRDLAFFVSQNAEETCVGSQAEYIRSYAFHACVHSA